MENLLIYFAKVILCSGVMFLYYRIFLKDKTFHHYNRFYLLGTLGVSLLLPLLKVDYFTININQNIYELLLLLQNNSTSNISADDFSIYPFIFAAIALVAVFFVAKFGFALWKIYQFKKEYPEEKLEGISFYMTNLENAPFSFFKNLFWKKSILLQSDLGKQILKHEMVHIEQKHSYDKMFIEILTAVFWFNPIFYFIRKEINLIHEYLADKKALKNSDTKAFAQMLLETHFSGQVLPGSSPFLNSNLKKRIIMLKKSNTRFSYFRKVFALPLLFCLFFAYMVKAENGEIRKQNKISSNELSIVKNDTIDADQFFDEVMAKMTEKDKIAIESLSPETKIQLKNNLLKVREIANDAKKTANVLTVSAELNNLKINSEVDTIFPNKEIREIVIDGKKKSVLKTDKIVTYYLNGKKIDYGEFDKVAPKEIRALDIENLKSIYISTKKGKEPNVENYTGTSYFIPSDKSTVEPKAVASKENQYIFTNPAITPPQSKYNITQPTRIVRYNSSMGYVTDEGSDENKTIVGTTDYGNAKVYINGKISDEKTAKNLNPKKIKTVKVKRHSNNDVEKNEVRITTKR